MYLRDRLYVNIFVKDMALVVAAVHDLLTNVEAASVEPDTDMILHYGYMVNVDNGRADAMESRIGDSNL